MLEVNLVQPIVFAHTRPSVALGLIPHTTGTFYLQIHGAMKIASAVAKYIANQSTLDMLHSLAFV